MAPKEDKHEATIKLTGLSVNSVRRAHEAVLDELKALGTTGGYEVTIKVKTEGPITRQLNSIESLIKNHRGVDAKITTKSVIEVEADYNGAPWEQTPMGRAYHDDTTPTA